MRGWRGESCHKQPSVPFSHVPSPLHIPPSLHAAITLAVFVLQVRFRGESVDSTLLVCLSLVVGAVPIALPLIVQVTMALGAARMANHHGAVITHTTALQEIASMSVLCSDKTGTLTTANMR